MSIRLVVNIKMQICMGVDIMLLPFGEWGIYMTLSDINVLQEHHTLKDEY